MEIGRTLGEIGGKLRDLSGKLWEIVGGGHWGGHLGGNVGEIGRTNWECGGGGEIWRDIWGRNRGEIGGGGGKELLLQARLNSSAFPLQVTQRRWSRKSKNTVFFNGKAQNTVFFDVCSKRKRKNLSWQREAAGGFEPGTPVSPNAPRRLFLSDRHQIAARYVGEGGGRAKPCAIDVSGGTKGGLSSILY